MIIKSFELNKINISKYKFFFFMEKMKVFKMKLLKKILLKNF